MTYLFLINKYYLNDNNAFIVALALFIIFVEPYLLAKTSEYPATDKTFLIAQPAIIQVPSEAGCIIILAALNLASTLYGTVQLIIFTFIILFLALLTAFAIASTTSQDFPVQRPIFHFPSQRTITALNLNCLQPEFTLVTLSIESNSSLYSFFGS
jgi:hypothetical protein